MSIETAIGATAESQLHTDGQGMNEANAPQEAKNSPSIDWLVQTPKAIELALRILIKIGSHPGFIPRAIQEVISNNRTKQFTEYGIRELWTFFVARWGWDRVSWPHLLRLINNEMDVLEYRMLTYIEITWHCNLRCKGCYIPDGGKSKRVYMEEAQLRSIIEGNSPRSKMTLILGGEPMNADTVPMLDRVFEAYPKHMFSLVTNGGYIAANGLGSLARHDHVIWVVSIDGDEENHNRIRRGKLQLQGARGQFEEVRRAVEILRVHRRYIGASIVIRESTFEAITGEEFQRMLYELGITGCTYIRARDCTDELPEEKFTLAQRRILAVSKQRPIVSPAFSAPGLPEEGDDHYQVFAPDGTSRENRVGGQASLSAAYENSVMMRRTNR